jgi:hypothetical protein
MDLSAYQRMDANILLGIVNEKLRLECADVCYLRVVYPVKIFAKTKATPNSRLCFLIISFSGWP